MVIASKAIEFEGHDIEDAIKKALKTLGVSRETITVKILSEEQKGLFLMPGAKLAKIKVSIKGKSPAKEESASTEKEKTK